MMTGRSVITCALKAFLVLGSLLMGCSSQKAVRPSEADALAGNGANRRDVRSNSYVIQYGDQIQLTVFGYPEFSCTSAVKESGTITIPLLGEIKAVGLTREQMTEQLVAKLGEYVKSRVIPTITVTSAMSQRIVVLGSVGTQGTFPLSAPASPFQVLALAGGPSKDADLSRIKVFRNGDPNNSTDLDLSGYLGDDLQKSSGGEPDLPTLSPGDMVYVPKEENLVRGFGDLLRDVIILFGIIALVN